VAGTAGGAAAAALGGGEALRRLLFEVFHDDISEFRAYCEADVSGGTCTCRERGPMVAYAVLGWGYGGRGRDIDPAYGCSGRNNAACRCADAGFGGLVALRTINPSSSLQSRRRQEDLQRFVEFADDTGAWGLLGDLLRGEASAGELLRTSPFFAQVEAQA
jgi:hypothetical protein